MKLGALLHSPSAAMADADWVSVKVEEGVADAAWLEDPPEARLAFQGI